MKKQSNSIKISASKIKKILILQTAFIGDVVMSTPVPRELHFIFPGSVIDILTIPTTSILFSYNPYIRKRHTFFKKKFFTKWREFIRLVRELRQEKYDLAVSLQSSLTSALLLKLAGIPVRIGYSRQPLMTHRIKATNGAHRRVQDIELLSPLTDELLNTDTELFLSDKELAFINEIISESGGDTFIRMGIAPGSVWFTKTWGEENYIKLVELLKTNQQIRIFFIGGREERALCQNIIDKCGNSGCINLAGDLNLLESAALISKLDLMVCNDSAPLHISNAVNTPVFAFFGPTVKRFGCYPYRENDRIFEVELECRPCAPHGGKKCPLKHHNCMKLIKPEDVYESILNFLQNKPY